MMWVWQSSRIQSRSNCRGCLSACADPADSRDRLLGVRIPIKHCGRRNDSPDTGFFTKIRETPTSLISSSPSMIPVLMLGVRDPFPETASVEDCLVGVGDRTASGDPILVDRASSNRSRTDMDCYTTLNTMIQTQRQGKNTPDQADYVSLPR